MISLRADMLRRNADKKIRTASAREGKKMTVKSYHPRTLSERFADRCTGLFGTSEFLFVHALFFVGWIVYNSGAFEGALLVDPYPFNFLTTAVSLEAIFLSIVVLMSQNRAARITDVRDEVDLQINVQSEREITKILEMLAVIEKRLHVAQKADPELLEMLRKIDMNQLEARVVKASERTAR